MTSTGNQKASAESTALEQVLEETKNRPFTHGPQAQCPRVLWNLIETQVVTDDHHAADWIASFFEGTLRCQEQWEAGSLMEERRAAYRSRLGDEALLNILNATPDARALIQARRAFGKYLSWDRDVLAGLLSYRHRIYYHTVFRAENAVVVQGVLAGGVYFGLWKQRTSIRAGGGGAHPHPRLWGRSLQNKR